MKTRDEILAEVLEGDTDAKMLATNLCKIAMKEAQRELMNEIESGNWMNAHAISVLKNEFQL